MNVLLSTVLMLAASVLTPAKMWFAPDQPLMVDVKPGGEATLVLTDFAGKARDAKGSAEVTADKSVNLKEVFPDVGQPGTYVLYVVKKGGEKDLQGPPADFLGTPLVINVRKDPRPGSPPGPIVTRVEPLRYAVMSTPAGRITMVFYYDVAPNTTSNFLTLGAEGFFDGQSFHRIVPGFVIQGGDPLGNGTGSPGYSIVAEFNNRPHKPGVLSMARSGDPKEGPGRPPAPQFANSASSQFFICLDYKNTQQLDGRYTAFGEVVDGMDAVNKIAAVPLSDPRNGTPRDRQAIEKVEIKPVTAQDNPYTKMSKPEAAAAPK